MSASHITGHGRRELFSGVNSQANQGGSVDFGTYDVDKYSRFSGVVLADSIGATGITFRYRMGVQSGNFQVSSTVNVGSGGYSFDALNLGRYADFAFTAIDTDTSFTIGIYGEPLR